MLKLGTSLSLLFILQMTAKAQPLQYRVWQLQDYNMKHIERAITSAAQQNINRIQLSHQIVMNSEQPLANPKLAEDINTICELAHANNIKVDMWTHELTKLPDNLLKDGKANLDDPELWAYIREKYEKLFKLCPGLDGLVLTMHETAMPIYHDNSVAASTTPAQRVAKLIDNMDAVCKSLKKDFFVRTFSYEPDELKHIQDGLRLSKSDVIAITKCVPHDWQPYYPFNPAIGDVGGKRQIVEFDLGHEFTGLSTLPYICIDYVKRHLDYDISKNALGAVFRIERFKWHSLGTPNQAVLDVSTRLLTDPSADPHELYMQWLTERYGKDAAPHLFSAFMRTQEILDKGYFILGFWITNHSKLPSYEYATKSLKNRTSAKWDPSTKSVEADLFSPTSQTLLKIDNEKATALALAEKSLADIEKAKPYLKHDDYAYLEDLFQRNKAMVKVWRAASAIIIGVNVYNSNKLDSDAAYLAQAADELEKLAADNKTHLINMAADYDKPDRMDNVNTAKKLVELARNTISK